MAQSPCSLFPLADSPCSLFYSPLYTLPLTWLPPAVTGMESPPQSQVGDKLNPQWMPQINGEGVAQSEGGGPIPAHLSFSYFHTPILFTLYINLSHTF